MHKSSVEFIHSSSAISNCFPCGKQYFLMNEETTGNPINACWTLIKKFKELNICYTRHDLHKHHASQSRD